MKQLRAVIRVDASIKIGSGHLMRCLTLANELRAQGVQVEFITREHRGNLVATILTQRFACHILPSHSTTSREDAAHAAWLGCSQEEDCSDTKEILSHSGAVDWLIVDHYAIDAGWETPMRQCARNIMVIDDLADRLHDCDLLLDQNLYANLDQRYSKIVPAACAQLLGPGYALISPDFARQRELALAKKDHAPYRLLVFFGGVDATDETGKFLQAWGDCTRPTMIADVIIGASNPRAQCLAEKAAALAGIRLHPHVSNMAEMMAQADYAFGASGVTNWERFCIGLNSTIVGVAQNQLKLAEHLAAFGLIEYLGDWRQTSALVYERVLANLAPRSENLAQRRKQIMAQVDGQGTYRVVQRLTEKLRPQTQA
ncbi:UDP-2,4-diacetamido-2,4,6-trideoxy-beta-L-altropyranose hydrolase [Cupriavidus sp. CuC1]|uniref:UDP-2,4-diacetamido-2,4, 6-trideoxy-beta-L-altropyranose hydrolase n=1 Tax=Cupriavidus sp. CuC1 TaxID=3373131 RepID=UPI0037CF8EF8